MPCSLKAYEAICYNKGLTMYIRVLHGAKGLFGRDTLYRTEAYKCRFKQKMTFTYSYGTSSLSKAFIIFNYACVALTRLSKDSATACKLKYNTRRSSGRSQHTPRFKKPKVLIIRMHSRN